MATIANPMGVFNFAHNNQFDDSSNPLDSLDQFDADKAAMSGFDPEFLQHYFASGAEEQSLATRPSDLPQTALAADTYPFGQASTASTASDPSNHALTSGPSSMGSPELHFPFGTSLSDLSHGMGFVSSAEQSSFGFDQFPQTEFPEYQNFLAGEKQPGFVGEWQTFPQSSAVDSQNLFPSFSLPSNDPSPFKKPQAKVSTSSSMSTSPADASPSFSKALWQGSHGSTGVQGRASSHQHPPIQSSRLPRSPQADFQQGQDFGATLPSQDFVLPENQLFHSPTPVQGARFQSSPQTQQSQFFHQTSGNFVAPLESSCRFFPIQKTFTSLISVIFLYPSLSLRPSANQELFRPIALIARRSHTYFIT